MKKKLNDFNVTFKKVSNYKHHLKSITNTLLLLVMVAFVATAPIGCKSSKKAKAQAEAARLAKEKEDQKMRDEQARRIKESQERTQKESKASTQKVEDYFNSITQATSVDNANASITEALSNFSSPDTPVLIVISKNGDDYDYDEPTTISKYLNYLKDQKKTSNKVYKAEYDSDGKIKELILTTK